MARTCIVMFSGGLDSSVAVHLLTAQGIEVTALHFVLPFESGLGRSHRRIREAAAALDVPLRIEEEGEEFLDMVRDPEFGYGKNINPCVDCRIHRLAKAKMIMEKTGAAFIATGEVVGQRPMSQKLDKLYLIEKRAGLRGVLLRPLCAKLLRPTVPEEQGWIDRSRLLAISGRGRREQMAYAREHGLSYQAPAGGCLLTNEATLRRFRDLAKHRGGFDLADFRMIAYGRHFTLDSGVRCIVSRNDAENDIIGRIARPDDLRLELADMPGPLTVLPARASDADIELAARICARYSKGRGLDRVNVTVTRGGDRRELTVKPADPRMCDAMRV